MRGSPPARFALLLATLGLSLAVACGGTAGPAAPQAATPPASAATPAPAAPTPAARGAASAVAAATEPAASGPPGGTFTIASIGPLPNTLHPYPDAASYSDGWAQVARLVWAGGLLDMDANTLQYIPYMASDWKVSADGKTFTFTLKDGLQWSDGQPLTADDFLFAWQNASQDQNSYVGLDDLKRIQSFTTPDAHTIVVTLKQTLAHDVAIGVANSIGPVPKHIWQGKPWNDPSANPEILRPTVVSGPYVLKDLKEAESATFAPNPHWFKGQPNFAEVVLRPGQQPTVAYELLRSNQAQWAPNIPPAQYAEAKANPDLTMYEWTAANGAYRVLEFNLKREPLKDKRVREALARAINRQDVIQVAENTLGTPQYSFLTPTNTRWYNPNVEHYEFDLDRARQLLKDAGYTLSGDILNGPNGQPLRLEVLYPSSSAPRAKIAAYLQQQYKQLGIAVDVKGLDANAYFDQVKQGNFDLSLGTWGGGSIDPDLGIRPQLISGGQQNITGFSDKTVDDLFKQGAVELDDGKRKEIYDQVQARVNDELPEFYLYVTTSFSPMSKRVRGVAPNKLDRLDYNDALARWSLAQ